MTPRAWLVLAAAMVTTSCGTPLMRVPLGPGAASTDAAELLAQALDTCSGVRTFTAEVAVSGRIAGRRARGRLLAGLSTPASAYLDAPAPFGASAFIFAAHDDDAMLLLPRDRRVLEHGVPADILEAVTGVPLGPADLRMTLTGCDEEGDLSGARALGPDWRMIPGRLDRYLHREPNAGPWRLVMVLHREAGRPEWRAEYSDFFRNLPRTIRLTSADSARFDLQLTLSQMEINGPLEAGTFQPQVPAGYAPITIDEIRDAGPLAERTAKSD